jgi:RNA polymerase sigma-70 factor (ECF subfamily)
MLRYVAGDKAAFEMLYCRHGGPMYRFLLRQMGDTAAAEEMFQDVWIRVIDSRARYEVRAKFSTWVYAIAHNRLMDFYRAGARASFLDQEESEAVLEEIPLDEIDPGLRLDRKRATQRLFAALAALPAEQREAFLLHHESDLSIEEIAATTGINHETAKSRLRYAVAKLRASLRKES